MSSDHEIDAPAHHLFERPLQRCPSCSSTHLIPVVERGTVQFLCEGCARCWHYELGSVRRVDPNSCAACAHHERCGKVFAADRAAPVADSTQ
jgi:transposase-like protein